MSPNMQDLSRQFLVAATEVAVDAAAAWCTAHGYAERARAEAGAVTDAIEAEIKASWDEAMDDARRAHECGMGAVASATFAASMGLAGIRAVQRYFGAAAAAVQIQ